MNIFLNSPQSETINRKSGGRRDTRLSVSSQVSSWHQVHFSYQVKIFIIYVIFQVCRLTLNSQITWSKAITVFCFFFSLCFYKCIFKFSFITFFLKITTKQYDWIGVFAWVLIITLQNGCLMIWVVSLCYVYFCFPTFANTCLAARFVFLQRNN